jgi:hypothetical protein
MKGMQKIVHGTSFSGCIAYVLDRDSKTEKGFLLGGNITATDSLKIAREMHTVSKIRSDIDKPVWHQSLRLPAGETLTAEKWQIVADDYMVQMGFSETHQRMYGLHNDREGQHLHIVANRIGLDGTVKNSSHESLKSTKIIAELEKTYGLTITTTPAEAKADRQKKPKIKLSKGEIEKATRTLTPPTKFQVSKLISGAISTNPPPTVSQMIERLYAGGVVAIPNVAKTGKLSGFSFYIQDGEKPLIFKGSQVGFGAGTLQKNGVSYDKDREFKFLEEFARQQRAVIAGQIDSPNSSRSGRAGSPNEKEIQISKRTANQGNGQGGNTEKLVAGIRHAQPNPNRCICRAANHELIRDTEKVLKLLLSGTSIKNNGKLAKQQIRRSTSPLDLLNNRASSATAISILMRMIVRGLVGNRDERERQAIKRRVEAFRKELEEKAEKAKQVKPGPVAGAGFVMGKQKIELEKYRNGDKPDDVVQHRF